MRERMYMLGVDKLVPLAVALTLIASATGNLPKLINTVRRAQFDLIQKSKASKWPKALILEH